MLALSRSTDVFPGWMPPPPPQSRRMRCKRDIIRLANGWIGRRQQSTLSRCPAGWVRPSTTESHCGELLSLIPMLGAIGAGVICQAQFPVKSPPLNHDAFRPVELTNDVCHEQIIISSATRASTGPVRRRSQESWLSAVKKTSHPPWMITATVAIQ